MSGIPPRAAAGQTPARRALEQRAHRSEQRRSELLEAAAAAGMRPGDPAYPVLVVLDRVAKDLEVAGARAAERIALGIRDQADRLSEAAHQAGDYVAEFDQQARSLTAAQARLARVADDINGHLSEHRDDLRERMEGVLRDWHADVVRLDRQRRDVVAAAVGAGAATIVLVAAVLLAKIA